MCQNYVHNKCETHKTEEKKYTVKVNKSILKLTKALLSFNLFSLAHFDGERGGGGELGSQAAAQQHRGEENEAEHSE